MKPDNALTIGYITNHPDNAARVLEKFPYSMTAELFEHLPPDKYLSTLHNLVPSYAAGVLDTLREEPRKKLLQALSNEQLSILLIFFDDAKIEKTLTQLPSDRRKKIISRMQFPKKSVGSIMLPPTLALPQDISVAEALKRVKKTRHFHYSDVIVLDTTLHYIGMISLNKLIQSPPQIKLSSIIQYKFSSLRARKPLQNLAENPAWTSVRILPVTDGQGLLVGILEYAALLRHNSIALPELTPQQTRQSSALGLLFQTLAILIETLIDKIFPFDKTKTTRAQEHDTSA